MLQYIFCRTHLAKHGSCHVGQQSFVGLLILRLDVLWYSAPDGVLTTFDGKRMLIAIPADTPNLPRGAETVLREIDGRPYLIFPR